MIKLKKKWIGREGLLYSVAEPEPGAVEPPYFAGAGAGAGAVIFVKNGSGSRLDKQRDFL